MTTLDVHLLSRADYDALVDAGVFDGQRIELLDGRLITTSPQGERHVQVISRINRALVAAYPEGEFQVRVQAPLATSEWSEPEPDFAITEERVWREHPTTAFLAIEVSFSSRRLDKGPKARSYAGAGIPRYLIVDLVDDVLLELTEPGPDGYAAVTEYRAGHVALPHTDATLDMAAILAW